MHTHHVGGSLLPIDQELSPKHIHLHLESPDDIVAERGVEVL